MENLKNEAQETCIPFTVVNTMPSSSHDASTKDFKPIIDLINRYSEEVPLSDAINNLQSLFNILLDSGEFEEYGQRYISNTYYELSKTITFLAKLKEEMQEV